MMHRAMVHHQPGFPDDPFLLMVPLPDGETASRAMGFAEAKRLRQDIEAAETEAFSVQTCDGNRHHGTVLEVLSGGRRVMGCRHCPAEFVIEADDSVVPVGEGS